MVVAILTLVTAIVSGAFGIAGMSKAAFAQKQAEYEANKGFARGKELSYYGIYGSQQSARTMVIVAGFIALAVLVLILSYKK